MFISYSTKDIGFVDKIKLLLYEKFPKKIKYVISTEQKEIGKDIPGKIIGQIEDCEWFLILLTRNSVSNPTVISEFGYAKALYNIGKLKRIIPIVERYKDEKGTIKLIDTGVFIDRNIESAKYFFYRERWEDCIRELEIYLERAYEEYKKPEFKKLELEGKRLSNSEYFWEAAEHYKKAAKILEKKEKWNEAINLYKKAAENYGKGEEYLWEASRQYLRIAQIYKSLGDIKQAAVHYLTQGEALSTEMDSYAWEAAKSYEVAGKLYKKIGKINNAKSAFRKAIEAYEEDENFFESGKIKRILAKI